MSKRPLAELVNYMQGKSLTYGWDAVSLYDQRKANELLFQQYVQRFNSGNYIEPMKMVAEWGDGSYKEHIYNLKLSAPRLSFESADPSEGARARLTMDMVGGMIVSTNSSGGATHVSKMQQLLPIGGPQLWMDQRVTKGTVSGPGDVVIDLKNADRFMANFVVGDLTQADVGRRFQEYFEKELTPEQKQFPLGRLTGDLNDVLTPKNFEIRTMKSDPLAVMGDEAYGDGAVMMFITLRDGTDGTSFPNANSPYLIPADGNGAKYTGAMLLSSRVLFDKIMRGPARADIGYGINFLDYTNGNGAGQDVGWSLRGSTGGISHEFIHHYRVRSDDFPAVFTANLYSWFKVDEGGPALTISGQGNKISFAWNKSYTTRFTRVIDYQFPYPDDEEEGPLSFVCNYTVDFNVNLDKNTGVVNFTHDPASSNFEMKVTGFEHLFDMMWEGVNMIPIIEDYFRPKLLEILKKLTTPTIDTFLARNLLFPGQNALQLSDAFVPGDLALFGQIDPLRTSIALAPMNSTIEAGSKLQFTLSPMPSNVLWSVKDVDGNLAQPGVISSTGEYTAPAAGVLDEGFVAALVTAKGTLNGQPVESSALVSVVHHSIKANPMYVACDPGRTEILEAESLKGERLEWKILTPQWGSTLKPVEGNPNQYLYEAGKNIDPDMPFPVDKIEIKTTVNNVTTYAYVHILIRGTTIGTPMHLSEASDPSTGTVQFELRGKNGPIDPELVTWRLLHGPGNFNDKTGVYTEPSAMVPGSFVVVLGTVPGPFVDTHAVAAVPLPLTKYVELIEDVNLALAAGENSLM
ncbi:MULTISPECIES: hypothetical protein [unclassified Pseudomonas]|uniref:hypothetical protein n=1 Tax=unclassified Pseudomonas TaxID=196821 RepID=UPI000C882DBF|nr:MULTISPECIES: hypothetical protein [unclassified Pseudomonas]PMZ89971.1 hypothetical protein C1X61_09405 [Pseudomonas sp. FW215-T2]PNA12511.1 hypothetical protein C1X62_12340 [Pseudomonas sp. FW215-R3]PNB32523.1 hypothetical protein C1X63_29690 [Pseudomonas sp. FW305-131]